MRLRRVAQALGIGTLVACGSSEEVPSVGGALTSSADSVPDSITVSQGFAVYRKEKLKCPGGDDQQTRTLVRAAAGGNPAVNGHTLHIPAGALSGDTYIYMKDVEHKHDLKIRIGMNPKRALSGPATLKFNLTRCNPVPTAVDVEREDNAATVGPAIVTGAAATIDIGDFSTYVLSLPDRGLRLDSLIIPMDSLAP